MKLLRRLLLVLVLLLVVGLAAGWLFLDPIVEKAIEEGSTYATGVETEVDGVAASFLAGRFGIEGLTLANPPGFRPEPFFKLDSAHAAWETGTILSDRIEMDELVLEGVDVSLEKTGDGTNYGKILDHLEKLSGGKKGEEKKPEAGGGKQLTIKKIEVRNVHARLHLSGVPLASGSMEVTIPSLVIQDFRSDGDTKEIVAQLTRQLLDAILQAIVSNAKGIFPADVLKDLGGNLSGLQDALQGGAKDALKGIEGALKDAGGLFDRKK